VTTLRLKHALLGTIAIAAMATIATGAAAQTYPAKPIRIIVGFAPGGPADVMARLIGQRMTQALGQTIVVENRPGAGGTIGARAVAEAEPDGYTLLLGNTSTLVIGPMIYRNIGYDPTKDLAPVVQLGITSNLFVVHPAFPPQSVREVIAMAKANPGKLNFASAGIGTPPHLIGEMFKLKAGIDIVHVPYKGGGQAAQAVITGEVQMVFENPATSLPYVESGKVRALAVTSEKRNRRLPELPTMIEAGVPDFVSVSFTGIVAPARTPADIVSKLNAAINDSLASPEIRTALRRLSVEPRPGSAEEFGAFLARERDKWAAVVKAAGAKAE
jgi:tripartite-type tricarboxylate transporter receptor subunit TctC